MSICENCSTRKDCSVYLDGKRRTECKYYEPMTHFEFMQTCTIIEEMAEEIYKCTMANSWSFNKEGIKRWLKQPHREE